MAYSFDNLGTAPGTVVGVRWWTLEAVRQDGKPLRYRDIVGLPPTGCYWPLDDTTAPAAGGDTKLALRGMYGYWEPGENTASCAGYGAFRHGGGGHRSPDEGCSCGFWAYWNVNSAPVQGDRKVMGVVEGYGKTLIGDKGFRCEKARLLALTCDFTEQRQGGYTDYVSRGAPIALPHAGLDTYIAMGGSPRGQVRREYGYEDDLAATAAIELELEARYGVPVYSTPACMLLKHPLTADYANDEPDIDAAYRYMATRYAQAVQPLVDGVTQACARLSAALLPGAKAMEELAAKMAEWVMSEPLDDGTTIDQALAGLAVDLKPPEG